MASNGIPVHVKYRIRMARFNDILHILRSLLHSIHYRILNVFHCNKYLFRSKRWHSRRSWTQNLHWTEGSFRSGIVPNSSLFQFSTDADHKEICNPTVAFSSPLGVRVGGYETGKVLHRNSFGGNQALLLQFRHENAGNLHRSLVRKLNARQEVTLESNITG
jgi:hypothetical protein